MEYSSISTVRYDIASVIGGLLTTRGGAMAKWSLVMCSLAALLVLSVILLSGSSIPADQKKHKPLTAEEVLALSDELEFAAIQAIHSQLDDNDDGKVDLSESEEFVQTELCGDGGSPGEGQKVCFSSEKSQRFHKTDKHITSVELWMTWHTNEVFNWTNDDVVFWLKNHVHLPQYVEVFRRHKITGRLLPKLATNSGQILQSVLLIADSQHRQKIQLRAMDAILFGPPRTAGYWKDIIMTLSILLCLWGVLYALRQRWIAQSRIDSFLEDYRMKEEELSKLRSKLELQEMVMAEATDPGKEDEGKVSAPSDPAPLTQQDSSPAADEDLISEVSFSRSSSVQDPESSLYRAHEEIEVLHRRVLTLESQLESTHSNMGLLQGLLQESCKREWEHLDIRKRTAEEQMTKAEKVCDKIKKRRSSLFGSLHLANSSALEEAGLQITKAVNRMQTISECFDEYHKRWRRVEHICGFQVCSSPSSPTHQSSHAHKYEQTYMSMATDSSNNSLTSFSTLDGVSLRQGGEVPYYLHRSSTLPHLRKKSNSLPEVESLYSSSKSRPPSVASSGSPALSGSPAFLKSPKAGSPLSRQTDGDVDITDCFQLVGSQQLPQHHQLHHSTLGSSSKRPETDIAELSESPGRVKAPLKSSSSVPLFLLRKESYSEAISNEEEGELLEGGQSRGGIGFSAPSDNSNTIVSSTTAKTYSQTPNESRQSLKPPPGYRAASNGLAMEAIKEERASQISLTSSGSSDASSQGESRAGSASPAAAADKPKVKSRSQSPRGVTVKGTPARNHRAISSDV